ncbi:MAG TPA: class I SAM-dependent methyltransferase [Candidatus Brocadiia bacterium]|nr:class I SAM-dependent methyltransferase [Candidatus Brocadiia bacterium]
MDNVTQSVRAMYEQFPYPAGGMEIRAAADARLALSYVERAKPRQGPIRVLDAGCGRGLGALGAALTQPGVQFLGVDINRVALAEAAKTAQQLGLANVRFQECNLMTLEGLEPPEGGFDLIYSLGVVHHMADPLTGLRNLRGLLAPHGAIVFMVYAAMGRMSLMRVATAIRLLFPGGEPLSGRLDLARAMAKAASEGCLRGTFWQDTWRNNDVEFVDRLLNVNETQYDVGALWKLLGEAGLRFVRWIEPAEWAVDAVFPPGPLRDRIASLSPLEQFQIIELAFERNSLELIMARDDAAPRPALTPAQLAQATLCVNPDVVIIAERRNLHGSQRIESIAYKLRHAAPVSLPAGPLATALLAVENQNAPFTGIEWAQAMRQRGLTTEQALATLVELVRREVLFAPHAEDAPGGNGGLG